MITNSMESPDTATETRSKDSFLDAAASIGARLSQDATLDEDGVRWGPERTSTFYSGTAGIVFFLSHVTAHTSIPGVHHILETAIPPLLRVSKNVASDGWMKGKMGLAFAAFEAGRLHDRPEWMKRAVEIAIAVRRENVANADILNGGCGVLLLLLYMYRYTEDARLLSRASSVFAHILEQDIGVSPHGLYLRRPGNSVLPLTGLGHGASGLALVADEFHALTSAPVFGYIARSALAFEDSLYDASTHNWVDGRASRRPDTGSIESALDELEDDGFASYRTSHPSQRTAWCNGKPGFIVTRLRVFEHAQDQGGSTTGRVSPSSSAEKIAGQHLNQVTIAAPDNLDDDLSAVDNFAYCCGYAGLAESYMYAGSVLQNAAYTRRAYRIGDVCLDRHEQSDHWLPPRHRAAPIAQHGFMRGRAGVGYFLLRLARPEDTVSPLTPLCSAPSGPTPDAATAAFADLPTLDAFRARVRRSYWRYTLDDLPAPVRDSLPATHERGECQVGPDLRQIKNALEAQPVTDHAPTSVYFDAECARYAFDYATRSTIDRSFEHELLGRADLVTSPEVVLQRQRDVRTYRAKGHVLVFHIVKNESQLTKLSGIAASLLQQFDTPLPVSSLMERILDLNAHLPSDTLKQNVRNCLQRLVRANILQVSPRFLRRVARREHSS